MSDSSAASPAPSLGKVGVHLPLPLSTVAEMARVAERVGVDAINMPDSPLLYPDVYTSCAVSLMATSTLGIHTGVTNPVTRHPSVTAGTARSLAQLGPHRTAIGIATGDSACWGVGLKGARIAELCEYVVALKALLRGEEATWRGDSFRGHWPDLDPALAPPVYVACSGPKILKAASRVADGLIIAEMGYTPEDIARVWGVIDEGCAEVGRDPEELEIWWATVMAFGDDQAALMENAVGATHWLIAGNPEDKGIPDGFLPKLKQLHFDTHDLGEFTDPSHWEQQGQRAKDLGVLDWLVERSARLFGTPEDVIKRMEELRDYGVKNWSVALVGASGMEAELESLGQVIARR